MDLTKFLSKLRCLKCHSNIESGNIKLRCKKCKNTLPLPDGKSNIKANKSLGERIFDIPFLYNIKIIFLNFLNRLEIPIDPLIKNREILDIGCGSYQVRYNPNLAKLRIGIDPSVKALKKAQALYPKSLHLAVSADKLPFKNKSFDTTLLLFTLHHLNNKQWHDCLNEVKRVTRDKIIIYDHVKNDFKILRFIQLLYWRIFDGGLTYPLEKEWKLNLKTFRIKKYLRLGSLFNHICFYELTINNAK